MIMYWQKSRLVFVDETLCENCGRPKQEHSLVLPDDIICPEKRPGWDVFKERYMDSMIIATNYLSATKKGSKTGREDLLKTNTKVPVVPNDLRERVAIAAMQAMLAGIKGLPSDTERALIGICAVEIADAFIKELNKHTP